MVSKEIYQQKLQGTLNLSSLVSYDVLIVDIIGNIDHAIIWFDWLCFH